MHGAIHLKVYVWGNTCKSTCTGLYIWKYMYGAIHAKAYVWDCMCMYGTMCMYMYERPWNTPPLSRTQTWLKQASWGLFWQCFFFRPKFGTFGLLSTCKSRCMGPYMWKYMYRAIHVKVYVWGCICMGLYIWKYMYGIIHVKILYEAKYIFMAIVRSSGAPNQAHSMKKSLRSYTYILADPYKSNVYRRKSMWCLIQVQFKIQERVQKPCVYHWKTYVSML